MLKVKTKKECSEKKFETLYPLRRKTALKYCIQRIKKTAVPPRSLA